jgi:hypothetical protein
VQISDDLNVSRISHIRGDAVKTEMQEGSEAVCASTFLAILREQQSACG